MRDRGNEQLKQSTNFTTKKQTSRQTQANRPTKIEEPHDSDDGYVETGLEGEIPSNYENNLINNPKGLTDFEVSKSPGRLG